MFEKKKWIGEKQIDTAEPMADRKDANNNPLIKVTYIQGGIEYFSELMLKELVTDKLVDATALRVKRLQVISKEILKVFNLYGYKKAEFDHLYGLLKVSVDTSFNEALDYLWGVNDQELSFLDLAHVLKERDKVIKDAKSSEKTGN